MKTTNVIRGKPIYMYRGKQYVYPPDKTFIKKLKYDEESGTTYVYMFKPTLIPEFLLVWIMISLVMVNILMIHVDSEKIYYNDYTVYYNGLLYLNLTSDSENNYEMDYSLLDSSSNVIAGGRIKPGESVITIPVSNPQDSYTILLRYHTLLSDKKKQFDIAVVNKDVKSMEEE